MLASRHDLCYPARMDKPTPTPESELKPCPTCHRTRHDDGQPLIKPVIIVRTGHVEPHGIADLRANGICCVEAEDPDQVRFLEPPPGGYGIAERAAIELFRRVIGSGKTESLWTKGEMACLYARLLLDSAKMPAITPVKRTKR